MARGDMIVFDQHVEDLTKKIHNLDTDTIRLGIVNNGIVPATTTADPRWGAGGTTNFAAQQVGTGGGYTGPIDISGVISRATNVVTLDATDQVISQHASGATDCYWGIVYNDTDAGKRCICAVDLGGPVNIQTITTLNINWAALGVILYTRQASS